MKPLLLALMRLDEFEFRSHAMREFYSHRGMVDIGASVSVQSPE